MKSPNLAVKVLLSVCFLVLVSAARAEKWVTVFEDDQAQMFAEVDVDSIRKGDDGLVYFRVKTDIGTSDKAVDCRKQLMYSLTDPMGPVKDWKSKGNKIKSRSNGAKIADFVCARAKARR